MRAKASLSLVGALIAAIALVSASGAATTKAQKTVRIDVSTRAAVVHYLRSVHLKTKGVVIERGARNYAGAHCPGKGWACASTRHTVVQIAKRGGVNRFACRTARCQIVQFSGTSHGVYLSGRRLQSTPAVVPTNTARCVINITAPNQIQACLILQVSSTANNVAVVYEHASSPSGTVQNASLNAVITQKATGASNSNTACVNQGVSLNSSTTVSRGSVSVGMNAYQNALIKQDSAHGGNAASQSATSSGNCTTGPLLQSQTESSTATGPGPITQNENAFSGGANITIDIEQNQSTGFLGSAHGANSANFEQDNALTAIANTPAGPVNQTQSSTTGGLLGTVNQDSRDPSTIVATQHETQCEDASKAGLTHCATAPNNDDFDGTYALHQVQFGPEGVWRTQKHHRGRVLYSVHKGVGTAKQTGNANDTFALTQSSKQDNDTEAGQTNNVQGDCSTSGNCNIAQQTTVNGDQTTNTQSGQNLNSGINCTGSNCTPTAPPAPSIDTEPPNPSNSSFAEFTFSDTEAGVSFLCQLDNGGYSPCSSPQDYEGLGDGSHTFSVEAKDTNGNVGSATSYTWVIATAPAFGTNGSGELTASNVDVGEFGYGGMRSFTGDDNPTGDGTGAITVSGVSGTVLKALLFWNGPTNSDDPNSNAAVSFADTAITGTNIGTSSSNCWSPDNEQGPYTNSQSYEADVTSLVTGNGAYDLSDFVKSTDDTVSDINGVSLVVFYNDGDGSNNRNVVLWSGNDSNVAFGDDPQGWDETLTGVPYTGVGDPSLDFVVGDGQSFDDGAVSVNGTQIVPDGNIFQGLSTPAGPASAGGDLWDVESFALPTDLLTTGSNSLEVTAPLSGDCLSLVAVAANMPAYSQAPPEAPAAAPAHALKRSAPQVRRPGAVPTAARGGFSRRK
jgi:hypothetical protein